MDDDHTREALFNAPWNQWNPPPLVLGQHVFSWMFWPVSLLESVEVPGAAQVSFNRFDDAPEITFRDPMLSDDTGVFLRDGMQYGLIGLGEKLVQSNYFYFELMYTGKLDGAFQYRFLSQGVLGHLYNDPTGTYLSPSKREREQLIFEYFRQVYFWSFLRGTIFLTEQQKNETLPEIRRIANDVAIGYCKNFFRFNGKRYRDDSLPHYDSNTPPTGG